MLFSKINEIAILLIKITIGFWLVFTTRLYAQDARNLDMLDHWYAPGLQPDGTTPFYSEVWGFVQNGIEYAVIGSQNGTHIVEISAQGTCTERAFIQGAAHGAGITNRDFMDHAGYLYSICDQGFSTLQIIDLHQLPAAAPVVYDSDTLFARAHTVWIDHPMHKMYIGGPSGYAMKVFDVTNPVNPVLQYTHTQQGYIHDMYVRNDTAFLNAAYEGLQVYHFGNMAMPTYYGGMTGYPDAGYNHSGKLSADGKWYVFADETPGKKVKLYYVNDLTDLQQTAFMFSGMGDANTTAHDPIFWNDYVFVAYYFDGLVVFDVHDKQRPQKIAWFDSYAGPNLTFNGVWGVYVLPSGKVLISDRQNGLYVLKFNAPPRVNTTAEHGVYPNPLAGEGYFYFNNTRDLDYDFRVYDMQGRVVYTQAVQTNFVKLSSRDFAPGVYTYRFTGQGNDTDVSGKFVVTE